VRAQVPRLRPASASSNRGPGRNARHEFGLRRGDWGVPSEPVAISHAFGVAGLRNLQCPRTEPLLERDCWISSPDTPPQTAPQLSVDSSVPFSNRELHTKEPRVMVNEAVAQFRRDTAALVHSFLSLSESAVVAGNHNALHDNEERHIRCSTSQNSTKVMPKNTSCCAMQCTTASGEKHSELQSNCNLHPTGQRVSTSIHDGQVLSASALVADTDAAASKEHAEVLLQGDVNAEHARTNSEGAQSRCAPADAERTTTDRDISLGDLHSEFVCPASSADNLLWNGAPDVPMNEERVMHTDDTMDGVTRHLMHARDKIEAVEHEFAQIMAELANYGKRFAVAAGSEAAQRKIPEYFCIDTPTPRRKEGSSFPPSSARSLPTEPIASMPLLER